MTAHATRRRGPIARTVGVVGELLVTAGVIVLLFIVWQIAYLGLTEGTAQAKEVTSLERQFTADAKPTSKPATGTAYSILRIPRLGDGWARPIREGVGLDVLAKGIGHYVGTAQPGGVGNAAFAGHRSGHGNPLLDIDSVRTGDVIGVETAAGWYVYRVTGHIIVWPTDTSVLEPVPQDDATGPAGAKQGEKWLTLTTCNPRWGNSHRWIVHARFETFTPRAQGMPATLEGAA